MGIWARIQARFGLLSPDELVRQSAEEALAHQPKEIADLVRALLSEYFEKRASWSIIPPPEFLEHLQAFGIISAMEGLQKEALVRCLLDCLRAFDFHAAAVRARSADPRLIATNLDWMKLRGPRVLCWITLEAVFKNGTPPSASQIAAIADWCAEAAPPLAAVHDFPLPWLLSHFAKADASPEIRVQIQDSLKRLIPTLRAQHQNEQIRRLTAQVEKAAGMTPDLPLQPGEAWSDAALAELHKLGESESEALRSLLLHCGAAKGAAPSQQWKQRAHELLDALGREQFSALVVQWLPLLDQSRTLSALSPVEWARRCALEVIERHTKWLFDRISGRGPHPWDALAPITGAILRATDPWDYLVRFAAQPEVQRVLGKNVVPLPVQPVPPPHLPLEDRLPSSANIDALCGLIWVCGLNSSPAVARVLALAAESGFRKIPGKGPRSVRVGNASVLALGLMGNGAALAELGYLKHKLRAGSAQLAIGKAYTKLAHELDVSESDLQELAVPNFGMTEVGRYVQTLGEYSAEILIHNTRQVHLIWHKADGKPQKSIPAAIKTESADSVKELLQIKSDIEKMLPTESARLEALYLDAKDWPFDVWEERYLNHPLVGTLARRLVWSFSDESVRESGAWIAGRLVNSKRQPLSPHDRKVRVSLWHPMESTPEEIAEWRRLLEAENITQPFKQTHREIYTLTPAEEQTHTHSNRFAAQVLRQHQFHALCETKRWKNSLRLGYDCDYPPATRHLPHWHLRAEFWVEGLNSPTNNGEAFLHSGAFRFITTDQVRFYPAGAPQLTAHAHGGGYRRYFGAGEDTSPAPLRSVPALVFSEIMRDVDLFVSVAGVGSDPEWSADGRTDLERGPWYIQGFGDLNASAQTRRELLERLIPKLKIANRCSLGDRFLRVQGNRHRYKIHLGSGNILIMPEERYLCIVPASTQLDRAEDGIFLPFEGDRTLAVILSKAFMLAADDKIKDPDILKQL